MDVPPENTMSSLEEQNNNDLTESSHGSVSEAIDRTLVQLIDLDENNIIHQPTCLICVNPHRKEIEQSWLTNKNHEEVRDFVQKKSGIYLSNDVIDNHMRFHYEKGIKELQKVEYIDRLRRLSNVETTTLGRLRLQMDAITDRMVQMEGITPTGDYNAVDIEKIKSQELTRLSTTMGRLLKMQSDLMGEMKKDGELLTIPKDAFVNFFNDAITNAKDSKERDIIKDILSQLAALSNV